LPDFDPYKPPAALDPGPAAPGASREYEFGEAENDTIGRTASLTRAWGVIALVVGALSVIAIGVAFAAASVIAVELGIGVGIVQSLILAMLPVAGVNLAVGGLYVSAGGSLRAVVESSGRDVALLMRALSRLTGAFRIEVIVTLIALIGGFFVGAALVGI
jgi:hypothetical protein